MNTTRDGDNNNSGERRIRCITSSSRCLDLISLSPFLVDTCIIVTQGWLQCHRRWPGKITPSILPQCTSKKLKIAQWSNWINHKAHWWGLESVRTVSTADSLKSGCIIAALATKPPIEWPTNITLVGSLPDTAAPSFTRAPRESLYWSRIFTQASHNQLH